MRAVVIRNVLIRNVDLGRDFLVQYLVHGERAPKVAFEIVESNLLFLQTRVEFLFGVGRPDLVQLALNVLVGSQQAQFFCPPHEDLVIDQLAQDAETKTSGLLADRLLIRTGSLVLIIFFYVRPIDLAATNCGCDFVAARLGGTAN